MSPSLVRTLGLAWLTFLGCLLTVEPARGETEARVAVPVASVHRSPSFGSERVTQVLMWDRVLILKTSGEWARVMVTEQYRTPEGYPGWMLRRDLVSGTRAELPAAATVRSSKTAVREAADPAAQVLHWVYLGTRLVRLPDQDVEGWLAVQLPGRQEPAFVAAATVAPEGVLPPTDGRDIVESAASLKGTPYLWGGMCARGIDCSGLVYTVYRLHGYQLPRDADQQFEVGSPVARPELKPGDLLFFGKGPDDITHVGIYMWQGKFLHASGSLGVAVSPLQDYLYKYQGARRILDSAATERLRLQGAKP
ncbi:MAG: NlpC/P60 family protein [Candidatus Eremiobacterota bacterium]